MIAIVNQTGKSIGSLSMGCRFHFSLVVLCLVLIVPETLGDEITNTNHVSLNNNQEVIKIGNTKTNNYNHQERSYRPTQLTQVVLNVPKLSSDHLRKSRAPTIEEFAIKQEILDIYHRVQREVGGQSDDLDHLGRIIQALNPKYIATERVRQVTFSKDPEDLVPLPYVAPTAGPPQVETVMFLGADDDVPDQLHAAAEKFKSIFSWDDQFVERLAGVPDETLDADQVNFKRVIMCIARADQCESRKQVNKYSDQDNGKQQVQPRPKKQQQQQQAPGGPQPIEFTKQQLENYNNYHEQRRFIEQGFENPQEEQSYQPYDLEKPMQSNYDYEPQASEPVVQRVPYEPQSPLPPPPLSPQLQQQQIAYKRRLPLYNHQQQQHNQINYPVGGRLNFDQIKQLAKTNANAVPTRGPEVRQKQPQQVPQWQAALENRNLVSKLQERYAITPEPYFRQQQQLQNQQPQQKPSARSQQNKFEVKPRWASQERLQQQRRQQ